MVGRGRLADHAGVDDLALGHQGLDHALGAVQGRAFLVAGDQEGEGAGHVAFRQDPRDGGDPGGDAALHVHGAASVQDAVAGLALERGGGPGGDVAGRHHVGVAGEAEVGRGRAAPGVEVLDAGVMTHAGRPLEHHAAAGEAQPGQGAFQHVHRPFVGGGDGGNADQVAGQFDRINDGM
ncbi:hypothetical protein D3C72_1805400 [compost metagenome]